MKSLPKVKLRQVQVGLNIAQNHSSSHSKSYLVIIGPNSHEKLTKSEIRSKVMRSTEIQYMTYYMCFM